MIYETIFIINYAIVKECDKYIQYNFYAQTDISDKMTYYEWLCDVIESKKNMLEWRGTVGKK